jgi:hypothetical protein
LQFSISLPFSPVHRLKALAAWTAWTAVSTGAEEGRGAAAQMIATRCASLSAFWRVSTWARTVDAHVSDHGMHFTTTGRASDAFRSPRSP